MRLPAIFAAATLTLQIVACSGSSTGSGKGNGAGGPGPGGPPTCESACRYYLQCKGVDASYQGQCVQSCTADGYTPQQLGDLQQVDCPSAIAAVEGNKTGGGGTTSGSTSSGAAATDCNGCQWDGQSCIWISPSTGLYQACGTGCCPGH